MNKADYKKLPRNNILCIDMKSFYASIEAVIRGLDPLETPLAVVGDMKRSGSVVLAATPPLKENYGIKTGSRLYEIPKTPEIVLVEAQMELYLERSLDITRLLNEFAPLHKIHVYSIDEAWLKLDGTEHIFGDKWQVAKKIKNKILEEYSLPCSIGLGPNMFLAKVAMDTEGKEKGLVEWSYEDVPQKLWPLPLEKCWGIGSRLTRRFNRIGIKTVGQLAKLPLSFLERRFGIMGSQLYYHAWGVDLSEVEGKYNPQPQSLGRGITLLRDYNSLREIKTVIFELCEDITRRARRQNLAGKTVNLGLGYSRKELEPGFSKQKSLSRYTCLTSEIFESCKQLLTENYSRQKVRKVNISLSNFAPCTHLQLSLFEDKSSEIKLARLKDRVQERYGYQSLFYGRSLNKGSILKRIENTIGGH